MAVLNKEVKNIKALRNFKFRATATGIAWFSWPQYSTRVT